MLVLDTAALLFWISGDDALSANAISAIEASDELIVSSISIWEIGWKARLGKLELPTTVREFVVRLGTVRNLDIVPVDAETWLHNVSLDWDHRDPTDRTIVASADLRGCPLVTTDRRIRAFYAHTIR